MYGEHKTRHAEKRWVTRLDCYRRREIRRTCVIHPDSVRKDQHHSDRHGESTKRTEDTDTLQSMRGQGESGENTVEQ
jgi:hypothetical protein